ncbi:MAG TPA: tRNA-dihydrouridine synthase, partial [Pseudomonadales bacterium]
QVHRVVREHLQAILAFYGERMGLGYARKHASWYLAPFAGAREFRAEFNRVDSGAAQIELIDRFFDASPAYAAQQIRQEEEQGPEAAAA